MARRPHVPAKHGSDKRSARRQHASLRFEALETRELLSVNTVDDVQADSLAAVTRSFQDGVQAYTGTQDARIVSTAPDQADYGGATRLRTDGTPSQAILLKWDLRDVPAGSTIQSATLSLDITDPSRDSYEIYALKRNWQEGQTTWKSTGLGTSWQTAGANGSQDRGATALGTIHVNAKGIATITLNAAGIAQVQAWIDNPSSNYGFIVQDYNAEDGLEFSSSEDGTVSVRPKLTLTYATSDSTTPLPTEPTEPTDPIEPAPAAKDFQQGSAGYFGAKDTRLRASYPTTNYGRTATLRVDGWQDDSALLRWDLSSIPAGSTVESVSMTLFISDPTRSTYEIYELLGDWSEDTSNWRQAATGDSWQKAGASGSLDRGSTVLGTITAGSNGLATFELNAAGIAVVQSWINNPGSNHGFVIQDYGATDGLSFCSSDHSTVAYRPKLSVSYASGGTTTPPPTDPTDPTDPVNQAPTVDAGAGQSVPVSQKVNLNGTVTDDGQPNPPGAVTTTWSLVSGPGTVTFGNAAAVDTTAQFSKAGTYVLQLLANDGSLTASDTVTLTVTEATTPQPVQGFFVSPNGSSRGDGSAANPWDLQTALSQPAAVKPGSTIYLRAGTYRGEFTSNLVGTAAAPITVAAYPGEHVIIDTYKAGATETPLFKIMGDYTNFEGFEIMSSDPSSRITKQSGSHPTDMNRGGVYDYGDYNKFINLVIHDLNVGIGFWSSGEGGEIYGSIIYNNGWIGPDRTHGHGIYTQNEGATKRIADNIIFNQFDYGLHAYGSQEASLQNYLVEGNTLFNNGAGTGAGYERQPDILIGGAVPASNITLKDNYTYQGGYDGVVRLGYSQVNGDLTLQNNYFVSDLQLRTGWKSINATGNTIVGKTYGVVEMDVPPGVSTTGYRWNYNHYYSTAKTPFTLEGDAKTWSQWKTATRIDSRSTFQASMPTKDAVFVQANEYEAGRANITVYNWDGNGNAILDLSSVLDVGATYEIHNVMNLFGTPTISGVYTGKPIVLPMKAVAGPRPIGYSGATPVGTGSDFGVFVVTSSSMALAEAASPTTTAMAAPMSMALASEAASMEPVAAVESLAVDEAVPVQEADASPEVTPSATTETASPEVAANVPSAAVVSVPEVSTTEDVIPVAEEMDVLQAPTTTASETATAETAPDASSVDQSFSAMASMIEDAALTETSEVGATVTTPVTAENAPADVVSTPSVNTATPDTVAVVDSASNTSPQQWTSEATGFQRLVRETLALEGDSWQNAAESARPLMDRAIDSVYAEQIDQFFDRLHDQLDTPEEREALALQIRDHLAEVKTTVTQVIDEVLLDLEDETTSVKDDLRDLFDKLAALRPWIGHRV